MNTKLIIIVLVVLAGLLIARRRANTPKKPAKSERRISKVDSSKSSEHHAVAIKFGAGACHAAKEMGGKRFLSAEAPRIPLPGCDAHSCNCHFVHYNDRRKSSNRRSPFNSPGIDETTGKFKTERRESSERRHIDDDEFF